MLASEACKQRYSLQTALQILGDSRFADQSDNAATWIHWRKSGTSKQLLGLLRAVIDEAPGPAFAAGCVKECALHADLLVISFLFKRTQSGMQWPAMREWIADQGGLQAMWSALAWSMALVGGDKAVHDAALREPVHAVISLTNTSDGLLFSTPAYPSIMAALTLLFSDLLPRDLASGNVHEWRMREMLADVFNICAKLGGTRSHSHLNQAFIVSWPHFIRWLRQQTGNLEHTLVRYTSSASTI